MARKSKVSAEETVNRVIIEDVEVERPISTRGKWEIDEQVANVIATADTGKARRLQMSEATFLHKVHMSMRNALRGKGVNLHYKKIDERTLVAWAERAKKALKSVAVVWACVELFTGCAAYNKAMGTDLNSPWWQCEKIDGGMAKSAQIGSAVGQIVVGPVGGLVGLAMDPGHGQAVQDCRRRLLEDR